MSLIGRESWLESIKSWLQVAQLIFWVIVILVIFILGLFGMVMIGKFVIAGAKVYGFNVP